MTNPDQRDLDYGQLGNAIYAQERHEWIPQRQSSTNHAITPFHPGSKVNVPSAAGPQSTALREPHRSSAIQSAAQIHPDLRAAAPYISQFLVERAQEAGQVDVLVGDLLAIVGAKNTDRSDRTRGQETSTKRLILVARGTAEDEVRYTETTERRSGWEGDDTTYLESNEIAHKSWTSWNSGGQAILQVCSPDAPDETGLPDVLAIRLPTSVQLFRPKYSRTSKKPRRSSRQKTHSTSSTSTIDPNPTELLHMPRLTGVNSSKARSAHVAFNPFDPAEIGLIMSSGMWIVYRIEGDRTRMLQQGQMAAQHSVSDPEVQGDYTQDGWHRLVWCIDSYHILVCDRQQLQLHEKAHFGSGKGLTTWHAFAGQSSDCITDMRRSTVNDEHVFLLTTSSISLIRVRDNSESTSIDVISSWRHYRDPSDISLRLAIIPHPDNVSILLYSSLGSLITQYTCSGVHTGMPITSDMDPYRIPLASGGLHGLAVLPTPLIRHSRSLPDQDGRQKASYFQISMLTDDLGIEAHMCYKSCKPQTEDDDMPVLPTWSRVVKTKVNLSSDTIDDNFVVPDDQDSEENPDGDNDEGTGRVEGGSDMTSRTNDEKFSVPYDDVYKAMLAQEAGGDEVDLEELLQNITKPDDEIMHLLEELTGQSYQIQDIDSASRAASDIVEATIDEGSSYNTIKWTLLASLDVLGLTAMAIPDAALSTIYSKLASHWLRSLPANTPTRARIAKEKIIRRVAASLFLTSHAVVPEQVLGPASQSDPPNSLAQINIMDIEDCEPTASPPSSAPKDSDRSHLSSLRRYATIEHPPTEPSKSVSKILSHWTLNTDPAEYDYTSKVTAADEAKKDANMSETDRKRQRRKEDRKRQRTEINHRKRAKLENINKSYQSQSSQQIPSQAQSQVFGPEAPKSISISQTEVGQAQSQLVQAVPDSAFQASSQVGPTSQLQPGKFGGRLAFRGKRKAGF